MPSRSKTPDRTRRDWVMAGLAALAEGGVEAVKIERLADRLHVSKGSFYWHFKNRADLLSALLDLWDEDLTRQLIADAAHLETPAERLRALAKEALAGEFEGIDSALAETAVQGWAARDERAAERLRAIDAVRVGYLAQELQAAGARPASAQRLAKAIYLTLLGLYGARRYNADLADDRAFLELVELVLAVAEREEKAE
jgi:AcrR family transcriptional regulator